MLAHILTRGTLAALAGAAMLAATTTSAPAFTFSAPSPEQSVAGSHVENVYYYHRGYGYQHYYHYHPYHYHHYHYHPYYYHHYHFRHYGHHHYSHRW